MKKYFTIILLLFVCFNAFTQSNRVKRIGLVAPKPGNLKTYNHILEKQLIDSDSLKTICIFHESQQRLIELSKMFVEKENIDFVSFKIIKGEIPAENLFKKNACTDSFYQVFKQTDALIFFGGDDIPPGIYGEKTFLTTDMIPESENWELSFLFHLTGGSQNKNFKPFLEERTDYLILGICLGMQEMNVASGGTLIQDIPYQIYKKDNYNDIVKLDIEKQHKNYYGKINNQSNDIHWLVFHHIKLTKNTNINYYSGKPLVASVHHQCVKKLGQNFVATAKSTDGKVIEAFANTKYNNVYGIQYHTDIFDLFSDDAVFKISPDKIITQDTATKEFLINFWKDFDRRLSKQR